MQCSNSTGNVSFLPVHFCYKFLWGIYSVLCTVLAFVSWRPLWITRHAGHTEYSYSVTRTPYRKDPSRFWPFLLSPETGLAILHYYVGGSIRRNSFVLPSRPLLYTTWPQGDAYPRILVDSPLVVICGNISSKVDSAAFVSHWH